MKLIESVARAIGRLNDNWIRFARYLYSTSSLLVQLGNNLESGFSTLCQF